MYSHEIENLLKIRNYLVSVQEYFDIIRSSQVNHVKYENDEFKVWTKDGYYFVFKIKKNH